MLPSIFLPIANHLWQSTIFVVGAALLTVAFRKNRARTRHWIWLAASVKFLIPFSLLIDLGSHVSWINDRPILFDPPVSVIFIDQVAQPFTFDQGTTIPPGPRRSAAAPISNVATLFAVVVWFFGSVIVLFRGGRQWTRIRGVMRQGIV